MKKGRAFVLLVFLLARTFSANGEAFILPDGLRSIEDYAFAGNAAIREIAVPDGVSAIGAYAFSDCDSLRRITIPESVETIGQDMLAGVRGRRAHPRPA